MNFELRKTNHHGPDEAGAAEVSLGHLVVLSANGFGIDKVDSAIRVDNLGHITVVFEDLKNVVAVGLNVTSMGLAIDIRPSIGRHGGGMKLVCAQDGRVSIRLAGV